MNCKYRTSPVNLDNVKISRKLAGAFALIVAVIVALGVVVFLQVRALENAKETVALAETVTALTGQLKRAVDQEEGAVLAYMLTGKPVHVQRIETHKRAFTDGAAEMKALTAHLPGAGERMEVLIKAVTAYQDAIIDPEVRLASRPETRHEALAMTESNVPTQMMGPVDAAFDGIVKAQASRKATAVEDQSEAFKTTKIALAVGVLTALVLSVLFGLGLAKMIATPIAAMTAAMRRLAVEAMKVVHPRGC